MTTLNKSPLRKVISGGQNGVDIAALITAQRFGLKTGGCLPRGCRTLDGPRLEYKKLYGMTEHPSASYPPRTEQNVMDSDGTLRIAKDFRSTGEQCTCESQVCRHDGVTVGPTGVALSESPERDRMLKLHAAPGAVRRQGIARTMRAPLDGVAGGDGRRYHMPAVSRGVHQNDRDGGLTMSNDDERGRLGRRLLDLINEEADRIDGGTAEPWEEQDAETRDALGRIATTIAAEVLAKDRPYTQAFEREAWEAGFAKGAAEEREAIVEALMAKSAATPTVDTWHDGLQAGIGAATRLVRARCARTDERVEAKHPVHMPTSACDGMHAGGKEGALVCGNRNPALDRCQCRHQRSEHDTHGCLHSDQPDGPFTKRVNCECRSFQAEERRGG